MPQEIKSLRTEGKDMYIEYKWSAESFLHFMDLQEEVIENKDKMTTPLLMLLGEQDNTADNKFN